MLLPFPGEPPFPPFGDMVPIMMEVADTVLPDFVPRTPMNSPTLSDDAEAWLELPLPDMEVKVVFEE